MSIESSYVYEDFLENNGLGQIKTQSLALPSLLDETTNQISTIRQPNQLKPSRPVLQPLPLPTPPPVIDKNPVPPPKKIRTTSKKAKLPSSSKPPKSEDTSPKGVPAGGNKENFTVGTMSIKKSHAAVAGAATAGGVLLWKLLF